MASEKIIHIATAKGFSSHPGHGDASKTVAQLDADISKFDRLFPKITDMYTKGKH